MDVEKRRKYKAEKAREYRKKYPGKGAASARKQAKQYYHDHKNDIGFKEKRRQVTDAWFKNRYQNGGWTTYRAAHCRRANQTMGLKPSDVTKAFLLTLFEAQKGQCYYTKVPFKMTAGIFAPSVDRKDSNKGYFRDNVVLCLAGVNYAKSNSSLEEFYEFLQALRDSA